MSLNRSRHVKMFFDVWYSWETDSSALVASKAAQLPIIGSGDTRGEILSIIYPAEKYRRYLKRKLQDSGVFN